MKKPQVTTRFLVCAVIALALTLRALAQNNRSFVATFGSDASDCTASANCRTFARALAVTNSGEEILWSTRAATDRPRSFSPSPSLRKVLLLPSHNRVLGMRSPLTRPETSRSWDWVAMVKEPVLTASTPKSRLPASIQHDDRELDE